ncbi:MAG: type VII secretion protein EssC [Lachnospiraceae bacterium]|nr:type VII secretion protein EssC [Candidatus Colinaster scatohippi]
MGHILSIYSTKAFKAYLLPAINNSDHSIIINKDIFCLDKDIELELEIIDNSWHFLPSDNYRVEELSTRQDYTGVNLSGSAILSIVLPNGENLSVMYDETNISFSVFEKFSLRGLTAITIGKSENCDIRYDNRSLISREHAVIRCQCNQWIIEDHSANGVFVNARRVVGSRQLRFGDSISIFGLMLVFLGDIIAVNTNTPSVVLRDGMFIPHQGEQVVAATPKSKYTKGKSVFHRSPRQIFRIDDDTVEIEDPPHPKEQNKKPMSMIIGPSMTMALPMMLGCGLAIYSTRVSGSSSSAFMYTGLITAISSAAIGTTWAITNLLFERKKNREDELHRFEAYSEYLIKCANTIKGKYEKNYNSLTSMYQSAEVCCRSNMDSMTLWNRNVRHKDFLTHRLGLGDMPFQVKITIPKEKFTLINDSLAEKPAMIKQSYEILHDVPLCVDLAAHRMIGIVSTSGKKGATDIMHNLVAQLASCNCYTDVKLAFLYDEGEEDSADWEYLKWLPHVWSEDKRNRYYANTRLQAGDVLYELTKVLRNRAEGRSSYIGSDRDKLPSPQYVLFVSNPDLLEGELITKYLTEEKNRDITTIILSDGFENLPNNCDYIIQNDAEFQGMYATDTDLSDRTPIRFDIISNEQLEYMSRTLSDIEVSELETGGDIPSSLTFFDMYGVHELSEFNVLDKWKKNRTYDSMKALIGQRAGGTPWYLDIHEKYHGPHGLIAGTTGSGKSETLQTYILSLALNFSPDDVGFFIIDYKGGGMANLFNGLPHMIGQISNLSGNQVKRAMVSIKSENKRRQRIFNEHGVNNINLYTRLYKNNEATMPVPHMFIIIDEFAELKREEPDFMRELISVAQVGRSLGVHLILATQKPSGTVDDNIWSNSKFRLCLRVQDRQDSNDMLHRPDAAYITQAGRCYMQVGNDELFELFQSGYSGAVYDEEFGNTKLDIAKMVSATGKAAFIGNRLKIKQKESAKRRWITTLVNAINASYKGEGTEDAIFKYFEANDIDYPYSEYAMLRVKDLIRAVEAVSVNYADNTVPEAVDNIIRYADMAKLKLPEKKDKTQLDAVVEYLADIAEKNGYVHNLQLWLPVLPEQIALNQLNGYKESDYFNGKNWAERGKEWSIEVPIGMYDDPVNQSQDTFTINLSQNGHHAIIGTVVSGKSTFIQTLIFSLAMKYTPDDINIYSLDYSAKMSTAFEKMPHVGGIMLENDDDKVAKFFNMLNGILEERKNLFKGGNYAQYVRANGVKVPAIIVCIDNYSNFKNKTNNIYENMILQLSKDGVSYGIFMVITAGGFNSVEIPMRVGENLRTVVCLELADKFQYGDALHTMKIDTLPEVNIKGRGLAHVGEALLEFQTALALNESDDFKRMEAIEMIASKMNDSWQGKKAKQIPVIPANPVWKDFAELDDYNTMLADDRHLPIAYNAENASVYGIDLSRSYCYLIGGKGRTGKTNLLRAIFNSAVAKGGKVTVVDYKGDLAGVTEAAGIDVIDSDQKLFDFLVALRPDFVARNKAKKENERGGMTDEDIYLAMRSFEANYIIIADLADFVEHVTKPDGTEPMKPFVENLLDKGALHNVFWFACYNYDDVSRIAGNRVYELFIRYKLGVHFGGNVASQRVFNFDYIPYMEQSKTQKPGIGMLPANDDDTVHKIVVPLVK